jgi:mannose-1-phosphate guanylyltransferase
MHAVILAGGKGIRLRPYTTALPKPLVPLGDDDVILDVIFTQLARQGFTSVTLAIHHLGDLIRAYVGSGAKWGLTVDYATETQPLGTFGPLFLMRDRLPDHFLVMNGDILTDLPFGDLLLEHVGTGAPLTVATYVAEHQVEFGVLDLRGEQIRGFTEKPRLTYHVSMGVYAMSRSLLYHYQPGIPCGADELILDLIQRQDFPACYPYTGLWRDIGRPSDYDGVNSCFEELRPRLLPESFPVAAVS